MGWAFRGSGGQGSLKRPSLVGGDEVAARSPHLQPMMMQIRSEGMHLPLTPPRMQIRSEGMHLPLTPPRMKIRLVAATLKRTHLMHPLRKKRKRIRLQNLMRTHSVEIRHLLPMRIPLLLTCRHCCESIRWGLGCTCR